jgi:hypothetical protein
MIAGVIVIACFSRVANLITGPVQKSNDFGRRVNGGRRYLNASRIAPILTTFVSGVAGSLMTSRARSSVASTFSKHFLWAGPMRRSGCGERLIAMRFNRELSRTAPLRQQPLRRELVAFHGFDIRLDAVHLRVERDDLLFGRHFLPNLSDVVRDRAETALHTCIERIDFAIEVGEALLHLIGEAFERYLLRCHARSVSRRNPLQDCAVAVRVLQFKRHAIEAERPRPKGSVRSTRARRREAAGARNIHDNRHEPIFKTSAVRDRPIGIAWRICTPG